MAGTQSWHPFQGKTYERAEKKKQGNMIKENENILSQ